MSIHSDPVKERIATLGGVGNLPAAPGTWGSLASLIPLYPVALYLGTSGLVLAILLASMFTLWVADWCVNKWGEDPSRVVIDEFAGQGVPLLFLPLTGEFVQDLYWLFLALLLFRFFDVIKPLGVGRIEHFPSGIGILLDDLLAGIYALICLQLGIWMTTFL